MSEGPIKRQRDAWKPPVVSSTDADRVCMAHPPVFRPYCGRKKRPAVTSEIQEVTCADCLTAMRAEGIRTP